MNANTIAALTRNTVFTNVALTDDGDVWWEGLTDDRPRAHRLEGQRPDAARRRRPPIRTAASPRRFAGPVASRPRGRPEGRADLGDPLRRSAPQHRSARDRGVQLAARRVPRLDHGLGDDAAAAGAVGNLRRDPFAMLPFCGYNMGDYFAHWLRIGEAADDAKLPKLFYVNWFRKDADGKFLWPGYGENSRVLAWVFDRCANDGRGDDTAIGRLPRRRVADRRARPGAGCARRAVVGRRGRVARELPLIEEHYAVFGDRLPTALHDELDALAKRLAE